jgi:hypothetical protein
LNTSPLAGVAFQFAAVPHELFVLPSQVIVVAASADLIEQTDAATASSIC